MQKFLNDTAAQYLIAKIKGLLAAKADNQSLTALENKVTQLEQQLAAIKTGFAATEDDM